MSKRIDLAVPFDEKEEAKMFDVEWDDEKRVWWTTESKMCDGLTRWLPYEPTQLHQLHALPAFTSSESDKIHLQKLAQSCEFREWMLLMLPDGKWGAFWRADLDTPAATAVAAGNYLEGCRFVSSLQNEAFAYMRENRMYNGPLRSEESTWMKGEDDDVYSAADNAHCVGHLTIAGRTIEIHLPLACEELVEHLESNAPLSKDSHLAFEVLDYLDQNTPDNVKYPLPEQLDRAEEMSKKMHLPISRLERSNRAACAAFIDAHKADFTMYRAIARQLEQEGWPLVKKVNNYVKWSSARAMLSEGMPWEVIAQQYGVKTKLTIDRYAALATAAEEETPELLTEPFFQNLIKLSLEGGSVESEVKKIVQAWVWAEFNRERWIRKVSRTLQTELIKK
ncbi:DUF5710 domain-containing protein [Pseudomonas sp. GM80]|uniref:DUF5710 domain-containing protein n=1 Tax=Pseudomonas sp. GM80 TaxID=1144339 RepID=UPI0005EB5036|nr:DUF5710 domain-containing protein [Pseudomonas sp. GM80]